MSAVTTHVLDTVLGEPASGVVVRLEQVGTARAAAGVAGESGGEIGVNEIGRALTDADGRIADFGPDRLAAGTYRLVFETAAYLTAVHPGAHLGGAGPPFFPEVAVTFAADGVRSHYHVPLLLSPHAYSTYRGS